MHDLVVKNGIVIDPSQVIHEHKNIAISKRKIAYVRKGIDVSGGRHISSKWKSAVSSFWLNQEIFFHI